MDVRKGEFVLSRIQLGNIGLFWEWGWGGVEPVGMAESQRKAPGLACAADSGPAGVGRTAL